MVSYSRYSKATEKKCNWAAKLFAEWKCARNEQAVLHPELGNSTIRCELIEMTKDELCFALSRFIHEVRKQNGDNYPSETLYELIISVQLYLASHGKEYRFLQDEAFVSLKNTLDSRMKFLSVSGFRSERRQAGVINREDEEKMWKEGVLGSDNPRKLLDTLIYMLGLHLALRAGKEHRNLRYVNSQISINTDSQGRRFLRYREDSSKTAQGGSL